MNCLLSILNIFICFLILNNFSGVNADAMEFGDFAFMQVYVGCYRDYEHNRSMPFNHRKSSNMTMRRCKYHCRGFYYYGLEGSDECYCGNYPAIHGVLQDSQCNLKCAGDQSQICGGRNALSVYERRDPALREDYIYPYSYVGCFYDRAERALNVTKTGSPTFFGMEMNVLLCRFFCENYTYFGVEYANECYCGNDYTNYGTATNCNMTCVGGYHEKCGGASSLSIYRRLEFNRTNHHLDAIDPVYSTEYDYPYYIGCYAHVDEKRDFPNLRITHFPMSASICDRLCHTHTFFGILNGFDCFCGNIYGDGRNIKIAAALCNTQCHSLKSGDPMGCGGVGHSSVYKTSINPFVNDSIDFSHTYMGCFKDDPSDRDLPVLRQDKLNMTVEDCQKICFDYNYLGIKNGRECWCGNRYGKGRSYECTIPCGKSKVYEGQQTCGGENATSIYRGLSMIIRV